MLTEPNPAGLDSDSLVLAPRAVLIVEDDGLLSMMLEDLLRDAGATALFPCRSAADALRVVGAERLDCAVLDIGVGDGSTEAVADMLAARNVPFLFCTGATAEEIAERHRQRPLLAKPYSDEQFRAMLTRAMRAGS